MQKWTCYHPNSIGFRRMQMQHACGSDGEMKGRTMEATGKALVEHWEWAASKGIMNKNTAMSLRTACVQVLSVVDDWESVDIRNLDIEETLTRFQNLRSKQFKPQVLEAYKRRFRQAVSSFLEYLGDPGNWNPTTRKPTARVPRSDRETSRTQEPAAMSGRELPSAGLVEYPFPLREDQIVRLVLPRDLRKSEVKRLAAFMNTLAVDYEEQG